MRSITLFIMVAQLTLGCPPEIQAGNNQKVQNLSVAKKPINLDEINSLCLEINSALEIGITKNEFRHYAIRYKTAAAKLPLTSETAPYKQIDKLMSFYGWCIAILNDWPRTLDGTADHMQATKDLIEQLEKANDDRLTSVARDYFGDDDFLKAYQSKMASPVIKNIMLGTVTKLIKFDLALLVNEHNQ